LEYFRYHESPNCLSIQRSLPFFSFKLIMLFFIGALVALPLVPALSLDTRDAITHPGGKPAVAKRALVCGTHGYDKQTPQAYFDQKTKALNTLAACSAHCLADSKCLSYAFGQAECLHYASAL
jgi:hypothetical protein